MLLRIILFIMLLLSSQGLFAVDAAQQNQVQGGKSFEHMLNLVKCVMHVPSVYYMNQPETVFGHQAIYLSQLATVLKILRDRTRFRNNSMDLLSDLRLFNVLSGIGYNVDCYELLKKIDEREEGFEVAMENHGECVMQSTLLGIEMLLHALFVLNDKQIITSSILDLFRGEIGLEALDMLEIVRLWLKMKHHSTLSFTEVEKESIATVVEQHISEEVAQQHEVEEGHEELIISHEIVNQAIEEPVDEIEESLLGEVATGS